jgi:VCBS repeat-containing protein
VTRLIEGAMPQSSSQSSSQSAAGESAIPVDPAAAPGGAQFAFVADPTMAASGDVLLATPTNETEFSDSGSSADSSTASSYDHAPVAPVVDADPAGPAVTAALSPDAGDDANSDFHFATTADAFWFKLDDNGSVGLIADVTGSGDDQGAAVVDLASPELHSGEFTFTAEPASVVHDSAGTDVFNAVDHAIGSGGSIAFSSGAAPGNLFSTNAVGSDGGLIIVAPISTEPSPSSAGPIPTWIIESSGTGGTSGGSSGTTGAGTIVNQASGGLVINVVYDASVSNAPAGFTADVQSVVNYFESHFSNPVTITIDVGYGEVDGYSLGSNALGESITYFDQVSYAQLQSALASNLSANGNSAAAATLPATSPVNGQWWVSTAEAEALGLTSASNNPDGYVGFSSTANIFAYNDANGVPGSQYDFMAVVAHEISEVMGRQMFDGTNAFGTGASYDPLDLFHYSAPGVRDFTGYSGYASADGGKTSLDSFNTVHGGDLADWASSAGNDAFNAFANPGVVNSVTPSDLSELNLLGWDPAASTPPTTPVVTMQLVSDTGWSSTDGITSKDTVTGTADPNAVVKIAMGSTVLGTAIANASGVWSFTPAGLADGNYTITASETNAAGLTGSASVNFTLDTSTPTVISETVAGSGISGGGGLLTAGEMAVFTLAMSEAVIVTGGTPALTLNDGGTAVYDATRSTSTSLVFDYTVAAGQYANALSVTGINFNGATVTEIAGNAAKFSGAVTTFANLVVDATTPNVVPAHAHDLLGSTVSATAAKGVLMGDSDANPSDVLSVSAVLGFATNVGQAANGAFGALTLNGDGSYSYNNTNPGAVTAAGGVTEDLFNYTVSNGHGGTANATLAVLITSPNDIYLTGSTGSTLKGGSGNYVLDGSAGNMMLTAGNQGHDWLVGGPGDTLSGGRSIDTFMFAPGFGKETINNFNATQDVIDLPQSMFANFAAVQADMHTSGANTVIMADANDLITLNHVAITSLHASNFHFLV